MFFCRYTSRVSELMSVLKDLNKGKYQRTMVTTASQSKGDNGNSGTVNSRPKEGGGG